MIQDLDATISALLTHHAPVGSLLSTADIKFDLPDSKWRTKINKLTVDCYLYDVRENKELRTYEGVVKRSLDGTRAARLRAPVRVDCAYSISAWSVAQTEPVLEEHRLLSEVLLVLLQHPRILPADLVGSMVNQPAPHPTVVASPDPGRDLSEFWRALDQELKPALNYVVTLGVWLDPIPADAALTKVVQTVVVNAANLDEQP
jgi:hypothetical protein